MRNKFLYITIVLYCIATVLTFSGCTTKEENSKEKEIDVKIELAKQFNVAVDEIEVKPLKENKKVTFTFDEFPIIYQVKISGKEYIVEYDQRDKFIITETGGK